MFRLKSIGVLVGLMGGVGLAMAQAPNATRPTPPTRDPHTPGYVTASELPDGSNPPANADGNFIIGPTHQPAAEMSAHESVLQGTVYEFTMNSAESKIYPGVARDAGTFGTPDPADPAKLVVTTSHPAPYTRRVAVYVPKQYVPGKAAPFIVGADGPDRGLFTALDNLIAEHRVPVMIAISIGNGSGDAQGSERGLEYDTMSGRYAEFVENEVLPLVETKYNVKLTKDPEGRATMGGSSGGSCALIMAWYHPELYHRVLTYSGTYVNQQWPYNAETPHGAWEFHEHLIPNTPRKPLRIWMEVGDRDLFNPNIMRDGMHDWVVANEDMAKVLAAKGYHYQFVFARNAGHVDRAVKQQTLPEALEYVWQGYPIDGASQSKRPSMAETPNTDSFYRLAPDALVQDGVPQGEIRGPFTLPSQVYPGTQHTYWVYVPAQYDPKVPASLMIYNDGQAFKAPDGDVRAQVVMDSLIYRREIPVMIGVFINPGRRPDQPEPTSNDWGDRDTNRPTEYNTLDDKYARVIVDELLPVLYKEYNISKDPEQHGIGGSSSGAIAAFTVAWERPDYFRKVLSNVGSFTNIRGGNAYPDIIRNSEKKPLRVFLVDGRNDNRGLRADGTYDQSRDWFYQNVRMEQALTEKGYDVNYSWGIQRHGQKMLQTVFPEMMRWLWRDHDVSTDVHDMVERSFNAPKKKD